MHAYRYVCTYVCMYVCMYAEFVIPPPILKFKEL